MSHFLAALATAGNGTAPHIASDLFKLSAGLDVVNVPYKGSAPTVVAAAKIKVE